MSCFIVSASEQIQVIDEPLTLNGKIYFAVLGPEFDGKLDSLKLCENLGEDYVAVDSVLQRDLLQSLSKIKPLRSLRYPKFYISETKNGSIKNFIGSGVGRIRLSFVNPTKKVEQPVKAKLIPVCFTETQLEKIHQDVAKYSHSLSISPTPELPVEIEKNEEIDISPKEVANRAKSHSFNDFALGSILTREPSCAIGCTVKHTKPFSYDDAKYPFRKDISALGPQQQRALEELYKENGYEEYVSVTSYLGVPDARFNLGEFKGDWLPLNVTVNSENEIISYQIIKFYDASFDQIRDAIEDIYGPIMQGRNSVKSTYEDVELTIGISTIMNKTSLTIAAKSLTSYDQAAMNKNEEIKKFFERTIAQLQAEIEQQNKKSISL